MDFSVPVQTQAQPWSLFIGQLGRGTILAAGILLLLSFILAFVKGQKVEKLRSTLYIVGLTLVPVTFLLLGVLFVKDQFQYTYVHDHSDSINELYYKVSAIWSGQEGSFLLWASASAIWALLTLRASGPYKKPYEAVLAIFLAGLAAILSFESPFKLAAAVEGKLMVPSTGAGLSPLLQNAWNVIHPPIIFTGFGSLAIPFAFAIAAMVTGNKTDWIARARPWVIASATILGFGLCLGGFWAYETLGWGGFWAWDPVENTSFVPWIGMVALAHGLIVQSTRKKWHNANLWMAGLPFLMFLYGTYLTRSGIYTDVSNHSFAKMDRSALKVLMGMGGLAILGFVGLALARRGQGIPAKVEEPAVSTASREKLYASGVMILNGVALGTAIGMSVPLIMVLQGKQPKIVEEHLYHMVLVYLFPPMLLLMAAAPFSKWKEEGWKDLRTKLASAFSLSFGLTGAAVYALSNPSFGVGATWKDTVAFPFGVKVPALAWLGLLLGMCIFTGVANLSKALELGRRSKLGIGGVLSHVGIAVMLAGLILSRGFERKEQIFVQKGSPASALGYNVEFQNQTKEDIFDRKNKVKFLVANQQQKFEVFPALYYTREGQDMKPTVWPHIERALSHDIYFSMAPPVSDYWQEPQLVVPGTPVIKEGVQVENLGLSTDGPLGQIGAKFKVKLRFLVLEPGPNGTQVQREYFAEPQLEITKEGLKPGLVPVGPHLVCGLGAIDAGTKGAQVVLLYSSAIYPIEVYYKPMTFLIYLGAGILTIGGILAGFYRRFRPIPANQPNTGDLEVVKDKEANDALIPTP